MHFLVENVIFNQGGRLDKKAQTWRGKTQQVKQTSLDYKHQIVTFFFKFGDRGVCHGGHSNDRELHPWRGAYVSGVDSWLQMYNCIIPE